MSAIVLYAESDETSHEQRSAALSAAGLCVYDARTADEALHFAAGLRIDVAIVPARLADMEGVELCRRLMAGAETSHMSVVLLHEPGIREHVEGLAAGATACLAEPCAPDLLLAQVNALLRERPVSDASGPGRQQDVRPRRSAGQGAATPGEADAKHLELGDLVDVVAVRSLMEDFFRVVGIPMGLVDTNGHVLAGAGWQDICTKFHRVHPETCRHCIESDTELCTGIAPGEFRLYKCKNNMWDVATPIIASDRHVGYVFAGQFFFADERLDRDVFRAQARRYGFDEAGYLAALDAVPRVPRAVVNSSVAFFVRLARVLSQLGRSNLELARAMAERGALMNSLRQREEQLRETADRLADANRLKDQFLTTLSHELRTPLSAIVGWSQMLVAGTVHGDAARRAVEVIYRNARAQTSLIDDILDVSRIVTGKMRLDLRPTDVIPMVGSAIESVRPPADAKGIEITTSFEDVPAIVGDSSRLQQVFWNILSNAVKFTPAGGRVRVSVACIDSSIAIQVSDSGIGIDRDFLPHVFERFRQRDSSTKRSERGLGLGLAIVRHLVDLHGGHIDVSSAGAGQGTAFTVFLPVPEMLHESTSPRAGLHENDGASGLAAGSQLDGMRVLVVDDDAETREWAQVVLSASGAQVRVAGSAAQALTELALQATDVLVSDIGMPDVDGYDLMRSIQHRGMRVPAVALSGYGRREDRERALAVGFERHLTKPVLAADLVAAVANVRPGHGVGNDDL